MEHSFIQLIFNDNIEIETEVDDSYVEIVFGNLQECLNKYNWSFYDNCVITSERGENIEVSVGCDEYEEEEKKDEEDEYEPPRQGTVWLYFDDKLNFIESDGALD